MRLMKRRAVVIGVILGSIGRTTDRTAPYTPTSTWPA